MPVNHKFTQWCNKFLKFGCSPHGCLGLNFLHTPRRPEKYPFLMQPIKLLGTQIAGGGCEPLPD